MGKAPSSRSPAREAVFGRVWDFAGIIGQRPQETALRGTACLLRQRELQRIAKERKTRKERRYPIDWRSPAIWLQDKGGWL